MRLIRSMKGGGCSTFRKNNEPKCSKQTDCIWEGGRCKKNKSNTIKPKSDISRTMINLKRILLKDSVYIDDSNLDTYIQFISGKSVPFLKYPKSSRKTTLKKYFKDYPTYSIGELSRIIHEDIF